MVRKIWRDGSAVKSTWYPSRGPGFDSSTYIWQLRIACNATSRVFIALFWPLWALHPHGTHICSHTHMHIRWIYAYAYILKYDLNIKTNTPNAFETFFYCLTSIKKYFVTLILVHVPSKADEMMDIILSALVLCPSCGLYCTSLFSFLCLLLTVLLSKVVLKHRTQFCTIVPQHKSAVMLDTEKICTLDLFCTGTGDSTVGHGFNASEPTTHIKCDVPK